MRAFPKRGLTIPGHEGIHGISGCSPKGKSPFRIGSESHHEISPAEHRPRNPFGSATTRPGALSFRWPELPELADEMAHLQRTAQLCETLASLRRAAIVGPHGAGKSTLLCDLRDCLARDPGTRRVHREVLHSSDQAGSVERAAVILSAADWLLIDGWEQLPWLPRLRIRLHCRSGGPRLLVTTHQPPRGFVVAARLVPDRQRAHALATLLLTKHPLLREPLLARFDQHWLDCGGNLRTLWAAMYDSFEEELRR